MYQIRKKSLLKAKSFDIGLQQTLGTKTKCVQDTKLNRNNKHVATRAIRFVYNLYLGELARQYYLGSMYQPLSLHNAFHPRIRSSLRTKFQHDIVHSPSRWSFVVDHTSWHWCWRNCSLTGAHICWRCASMRIYCRRSNSIATVFSFDSTGVT